MKSRDSASVSISVTAETVLV